MSHTGCCVTSITIKSFVTIIEVVKVEPKKIMRWRRNICNWVSLPKGDLKNSLHCTPIPEMGQLSHFFSPQEGQWSSISNEGGQSG
mmetsp:Transcript_8711/g.32162  ORF Transcript_8711/g.32162 Transcript_8711/m.32162 type:complete len:86 (+) Transcript_8711:2003-2260(+)